MGDCFFFPSLCTFWAKVFLSTFFTFFFEKKYLECIASSANVPVGHIWKFDLEEYELRNFGRKFNFSKTRIEPFSKTRIGEGVITEGESIYRVELE